MVNIKLEEYEVVVDLPHAGMYTFWSVSASGKSYVAKLLKTANSLNVSNILCLTYDVCYDAESYVSKIKKKSHHEIIYLDRFDLYATREIMDALVEVSNTTIVLMDLKSIRLIDEYSYDCSLARLHFADSRLEVSL